MLQKGLLSVVAFALSWSVSLAEEIGGVKFQCAASPVVTVDEPFGNDGRNYNREKVTWAFGVYAAASYDAYEPAAKRRNFYLADEEASATGKLADYGQTGWRKVERHEEQNGLLVDIYTRDESHRIVVLAAYRGTDGWFDVDLLANLSWFTQWLNPWDQYRSARRHFEAMAVKSIASAAGKSVTFVTTGHSLGGGLAEHVATVFPCTSAVTFNPSFVTNTFLFGKHTPVVVKVYEDNDTFSVLAGRRPSNTMERAVYRLNATKMDGYQHSMEALAAGILRTTLACRQREDCKVSEARDAHTLYCLRYTKLRKRTDVVC